MESRDETGKLGKQEATPEVKESKKEESPRGTRKTNSPSVGYVSPYTRFLQEPAINQKFEENLDKYLGKENMGDLGPTFSRIFNGLVEANAPDSLKEIENNFEKHFKPLVLTFNEMVNSKIVTKEDWLHYVMVFTINDFFDEKGEFHADLLNELKSHDTLVKYLTPPISDEVKATIITPYFSQYVCANKEFMQMLASLDIAYEDELEKITDKDLRFAKSGETPARVYQNNLLYAEGNKLPQIGKEKKFLQYIQDVRKKLDNIPKDTLLFHAAQLLKNRETLLTKLNSNTLNSEQHAQLILVLNEVEILSNEIRPDEFQSLAEIEYLFIKFLKKEISQEDFEKATQKYSKTFHPLLNKMSGYIVVGERYFGQNIIAYATNPTIAQHEKLICELILSELESLPKTNAKDLLALEDNLLTYLKGEIDTYQFLQSPFLKKYNSWGEFKPLLTLIMDLVESHQKYTTTDPAILNTKNQYVKEWLAEKNSSVEQPSPSDITRGNSIFLEDQSFQQSKFQKEYENNPASPKQDSLESPLLKSLRRKFITQQLGISTEEELNHFEDSISQFQENIVAHPFLNIKLANPHLIINPITSVRHFFKDHKGQIHLEVMSTNYEYKSTDTRNASFTIPGSVQASYIYTEKGFEPEWVKFSNDYIEKIYQTDPATLKPSSTEFLLELSQATQEESNFLTIMLAASNEQTKIACEHFLKLVNQDPRSRELARLIINDPENITAILLAKEQIKAITTPNIDITKQQDAYSLEEIKRINESLDELVQASLNQKATPTTKDMILADKRKEYEKEIYKLKNLKLDPSIAEITQKVISALQSRQQTNDIADLEKLIIIAKACHQFLTRDIDDPKYADKNLAYKELTQAMSHVSIQLYPELQSALLALIEKDDYIFKQIEQANYDKNIETLSLSLGQLAKTQRNDIEKLGYIKHVELMKRFIHLDTTISEDVIKIEKTIQAAMLSNNQAKFIDLPIYRRIINCANGLITDPTNLVEFNLLTNDTNIKENHPDASIWRPMAQLILLQDHLQIHQSAKSLLTTLNNTKPALLRAKGEKVLNEVLIAAAHPDSSLPASKLAKVIDHTNNMITNPNPANVANFVGTAKEINKLPKGKKIGAAMTGVLGALLIAASLAVAVLSFGGSSIFSAMGIALGASMLVTAAVSGFATGVTMWKLTDDTKLNKKMESLKDKLDDINNNNHRP